MIGAKKILEIHDYIIEQEGGLRGDHGIGAIEGALSRVVNRLMYECMDDVYEIAAMYAVAIARGHVFNDGNKRTALAAALAYLESQDIILCRSTQLDDIMVDVAQGLVSHEELSQMFFALANS